MIGIDGQCVITITQAHLRPSTLSVWKLGRRSTLIHSWSKNLDELIDKNRQVRQNSFCVDYIFSNTMSTVTVEDCLLYTSPSPRDATLSRMPSSA